MNKTKTEVIMDAPETGTGMEQALLGSSSRIVGLGIMEATGKDGKTNGWLQSVLARTPSGKCKYTALEEVVSGLPLAYAKVWNKYTRLFRSREDALRALQQASVELNMPILRKEAEAIANGLPKAEEKAKAKAKTPSQRILETLEKIDGKEGKVKALAEVIYFLELDMDGLAKALAEVEK